MPQPARTFFAIAALVGLSPLQAANSIEAGATEAAVYLTRQDERTRLRAGQSLAPGDRVETDAGARAEVRLDDGIRLILGAASELRILDVDASDASAAEAAEIYLHRGRACLLYQPEADQGEMFRLNVGHMLFVAMRHRGHFCAARGDGMTAVSLRDGSLQLSHSVDPSLIVLSESGTELRIDDAGEFELLLPDGDAELTIYDESPLAPADDAAAAETDSATAQPASTETGPAGAQDPSAEAKSTGAYRYTVYLFSTRAESVAAEVNQELHDAGHRTEIIVSSDAEVPRYRVAMPGFTDRQSAEEFASAIVGQFGIANTWIGRQRKESE